MNDKRLTLIIVATLALAGCANEAQPFYIEKLQPFEPDCSSDFDSIYFTSGGSLDVAAGAPQFLALAKVAPFTDNSGPQEVAFRTGEVLELEGRNRPVIHQVVVNYRLSRRLGATPREYVQNLTTPLDENGKALFTVQLISPDLGTLLFDSLTPSNDLEDAVDLTVEVEMTGLYESTGNAFTSGVYSYPIRVFRSNPTACVDNPATPAVERFQRIPPNGLGGSGCEYVGQSFSQNFPKPPPSTCCTPGTSGC